MRLQAKRKQREGTKSHVLTVEEVSSSSTLTTLTAVPCLLLWTGKLPSKVVSLLWSVSVRTVSCSFAEWNAIGYACRRDAQSSEQVGMIIQNCTK